MVGEPKINRRDRYIEQEGGKREKREREAKYTKKGREL
jgi:hypothetical protein